MPTTAFLVGLVLFCLLIYQGLIVIPLGVFHVIHFATWIKWIVGLAIVSWLIGDA